MIISYSASFRKCLKTVLPIHFMIAITGGAGFIGSWVAERMKDRDDVLIIDNLFGGSKENISEIVDGEHVRFIRADVVESSDLLEDADVIFHFAADPNVKRSAERTAEVFRVNVEGTFRVLEAARKGRCKKLFFASSSAVYGNAEKIPTPESSPLKPISNYGASKASGEMMCRAYSHLYGIDITIMRLANIFGPRSDHGVMFDFIQKLKLNPRELEIWGNGLQRKSYLYITDLLDAIELLLPLKGLETFNIGHEEWITVNEIAEEISKAMGLSPKFIYRMLDGRLLTKAELDEYQKDHQGLAGWRGDVPQFLLDISKIKALGWRPKVGIKEGISRYVETLKRRSL